MSPFGRLSKNLVLSIRIASYVSGYIKEDSVSDISLVAGILLNKESLAKRVLDEMNIDSSSVIEAVTGKKNFEIVGNVKIPMSVKLSSSVENVLRRAYALSLDMEHSYVGTEHALLALLENDSPKIKKLSEFGLTADTFREHLSKVGSYPAGILSRPDIGKPNLFDDGLIEEQSSDLLGEDLVELARMKRLDSFVGREKEMAQLVSILNRKKKNNPIIIGDAGVGKTSLVYGLAQMIANGNVDYKLRDAKIATLDVARIMAGSKMRGDVEEKIMGVVEEVVSSPNTILFIDDIHTILTTGLQGGMSDVASALKPALSREDFRCIGATTTDAYTMYFETDSALVRRFQPVLVDEMSVGDTVSVLSELKKSFESYHNVFINDDAIVSSVSLASRYITDRYLPDKAIDVLDEACVMKKLELEEKFKSMSELKSYLELIKQRKDRLVMRDEMDLALDLQNEELEVKNKLDKELANYLKQRKYRVNRVSVEDTREVVSKHTGIPLKSLGSKEKDSLLRLQKTLSTKVIGQEEACEAVANSIKRARTGILDTERPWASFLFLGPTGVGKTELAKVLCRELFGKEDNLIQIDMSEMMEIHSVSKLIGSPPGYVGFQEGGWLTEKVRKNPHSVILFDEIEKAHPDVLNVLLQILEYGHLMDGRGRRVDFKNTIVVLTSNIGAEEIGKDRVLGFSTGKRKDVDMDKAYSSMQALLMGELKKSLRPELLNRLDDIVVFRALTKRDLKKIVRLLESDLNRRLAEENVKVELDDRAVSYIVRESFDEEYGARPLRRFLQNSVENLIASYILNSKSTKSCDVDIVKIGVKENKLTIL